MKNQTANVVKAEHRGWENAECIATDKFGEDKVRSAIKFIESCPNQ